MDITIEEIVAYWTNRRSEVGMAVDWTEAHLLCWRCAHKRNLQRCHIVPRSLGGSDQPENLVLLCKQCHTEAPNVADSEFMWTWLKAHAVPYYGSYWQLRGLQEYEFVFGTKPFKDLDSLPDFEDQLKAMAKELSGTTSTHWGQGKLNPSTVAWLIHQVEQRLAKAK
ncbi:HNH endonuclease [Comamonas terrae]|uniref:HNH endonuclease n=1 Tax=Comamonas terrae TaxID=673548 RepID=A0ABW5UPU0_9BURK|nr:HNH endonuclease [Comamonas terrae]